MHQLFLLLILAGLEYNSSLFLSGRFNSAAAGESCIYVADGRGVSVFGLERFDRYGGSMIAGESRVIGYYRGRVFVGGTRGLVELDTSECIEPRPKLGWIHEEPVTALAFAGDTLWFADSRGFLYGKDLARSSDVQGTPVKLSAPPVRIVAHGSEIFLASDTLGLWVVDLKKDALEATPVRIEGNPAVMDIVFGDGAAWLACGEDSLWTVEFKRTSARVVSKSAASGELTRLVRFGTRLAAAAGTGDFLLFSLKDPRKPALIQAEPQEGLARDLVKAGDYCFVLTGSAVVKMVIPADGRAVGGLYYLGAGEGYELRARDEVGVMALGKAGARAVSLGDSLTLLGSYREPVDCRRVYLFGSEAYALTAGNIIYIVDLKDPLRPVKRSYNQFSSVVSGLDARGEMVLVAEEERGLGAWWRCPCGPVKEQGRWTPGGRVMDVKIKGKLAFVTATPGMLYVVDWSDSTRLEEVSSLSLGHDYQRLYLFDEQLFALDSSGRLEILDVSRPTRPKEAASLELPGTPLDLAVYGARLFAAAGQAGVYEIDISNAASLSITASYDVSPARGVAIAGEKLLILTPYSIESYKIIP